MSDYGDYRDEDQAAHVGDVPAPDNDGHWTRTPAGGLYYHANDPAREDDDLAAHVADELRLEPTPQPDGYYYLYKRNYRGGWNLNETSDAGTAAAYRAWGYQDTTEADFDDKWQQNGARWTAKGEAHNA